MSLRKRVLASRRSAVQHFPVDIDLFLFNPMLHKIQWRRIPLSTGAAVRSFELKDTFCPTCVRQSSDATDGLPGTIFSCRSLFRTSTLLPLALSRAAADLVLVR